MQKTERVNTVLKTVRVLAASNAVMSLVQIMVGLFSYSDALIADGVHTLLDLMMDGVTYVACRLGSRPPDRRYAYGYKRIETLASLLLAFLLIGIGLWVMFEAVSVRSVHAVRSELVIIVALLTMLINEMLYRYANACAVQVRSALLAASAAHQRSDALSSLIVLVSAVCDLWVPAWHFDGIAAFIIGLFIGKMGLKIAWKSILEILDVGLDTAKCSALTAFIMDSPGVSGVHCLRTRCQAGDIYVDAHIITDPFISVSEGHFVGEKLRRNILRHFDEIVDVVVHIDAEDDTYLHDCDTILPERLHVEKVLSDSMTQMRFKYTTTIHYVAEKLYIDVVLLDHYDKAVLALWLHRIQSVFAKQNIPVRIRAYGYITALDFLADA